MKRAFTRTLLLAIAASFFFTASGYAYWIWTPATKKFINPKNAVKDSPKEQFEYAMGMFNAKDYKRAAVEFDKLLKSYAFAEQASEAQFYLGLSHEFEGKYYTAFQDYQKVIDDYPHTTRLDEILKHQFDIGNVYLTRANARLMGTELMAPLDRAIEIFKKIVDNSPYGPYGDKAQYKLGESYKKAELYEDSIVAFQKLVEDYPASPLVADAKYEIAQTAYLASEKSAYDNGASEKAIEAYRSLSDESKDAQMTKEATEVLDRLTDRMAERVYVIAKFYERQKHYASAVVYYKEILQKYPKSSFAKEAAQKVDAFAAKAKKQGKP